MFNDNVAQTYNFKDASQEIIIMLLGAFLLGALLTWLLSKLFSKDYSVDNNNYRYQNQGNHEINTLSQSPNSHASTTSEVRIVDKPSNPIKAENIPDDLSKISGLDSTMQAKLKKMGISSYAHLRDIKSKDLIAIQQNKESNKKEIETWPHQAGLAAKGDWNKLKDYQGFIQRVRVASKTTAIEEPLETVETKNQPKTDNLTKLIGINPQIESILNKKEIYTFSQLSNMDNDSLKNHLLESEAPYVESETESWPHQAAMAEKGQWDELKIYQDFMHSDSDAESTDSLDSQSNKTTLNNLNAESEKISLANNITRIDRNKDKKSNNEHSDQNMSDHDDLKKIEGIGPKIEEVLNAGGIYTFSQLYKSDRSRLRKLLDDAGNQFRMHNPDSWPHQAGMANRSEWGELKTYQTSISKELSESKEQVVQSDEDSKLKSVETKKSDSNLKDDLRKIEGIGPKIQELLNNAGINSFKELSESSRDKIKALLNEAGPQFRMHEPESWPHQAKLAAKEEWKELEEYQDFLVSGRE